MWAMKKSLIQQSGRDSDFSWGEAVEADRVTSRWNISEHLLNMWTLYFKIIFKKGVIFLIETVAVDLVS